MVKLLAMKLNKKSHLPPIWGVGGVWDTAKKSENSGRFKTGENHPNYGQPRTEGAGRSSQSIEVTDIKNNQTTTYDSINEVARALNINRTSIVMYFANN